MKILTYNLRDGARDTLDELLKYISQQDPDIICLQEVNDWQSGRPITIQQFAHSTGYQFWQFGDSNTKFKLLTLSKRPLITSQTVTTQLWHGAVGIVIKWQRTPFSLWNLHLNPQNETSRLAEITYLRKMYFKDSIPTLCVGDFNSLSRRDKYGDATIADLRSHDISKFGSATLDYDVTDFLMGSGMKDTASALGNLARTVPTPSNTDPSHSVSLRLDYAFANPLALPHIREVSVIKNHLTDTISDHYPLLIDLM